MSRITGCLSVALLLSYGLFPNVISAGDIQTADDHEKELLERWYATYDRVCKSLEVAYSGEAARPATFELERLLTMYNSIARGVRHGRVYLWTDQGRPVVIGCIFSQGNAMDAHVRNVAYEFHSLAQHAVQIKNSRGGVWNCFDRGVSWIDGPDVAAAADGRTARLAQMRSIARGYDAGRYRLLTQPIYRYPEDTPGAIDGAIFAYVSATDPQIFLVVEAHSGSWSVACARSTVLPVHLKEGDTIIWSCERVKARRPNAPFFVYFLAEQRRADDPDVILSIAGHPTSN